VPPRICQSTVSASIDRGENFVDSPGMQPGRLIDADMADIRVTAHIDLGQRAIEAGPALPAEYLGRKGVPVALVVPFDATGM
jgi:hypothetical protein